MKRFLFALIACLAAIAAPAQTDTVVSIVNVYPGKVFYELEGHTVLRVAFPDGRDYAVSYGTFDFEAPNFLYRFVKGETDYFVSLVPWQLFVDEYTRQHRRIVEHRLAFDHAQTRRLVGLLEENLLPENRIYRYNYVKDNCATRPLRLVELAAGDSIILGPAPFESQPLMRPTFRNVMRLYHSYYPWYQFGIDLALGSGIDYMINRREMSFAPVELDGQLPAATVGGRPLVSSNIVVADFAPFEAVEPPTPWYLTPLAVFGLLFVLIVAVTVRDQRRHRVTRWVDAVLYGVYGIAGLVLTYLIFVSVHEATSPNWLYLWLNPLCLIPTIFIWLKKCKGLVLSYQIVNFVVLFLLAAMWYWLPQSANPAFVPLLLADAVRSASYIRLNYKSNA
ncbi:MAG: DUF4105 domain-containing protein [Bacteroidales bacterium]|nr:DUF4105 domain-containing protein [Bacteroidales bacterium]